MAEAYGAAYELAAIGLGGLGSSRLHTDRANGASASYGSHLSFVANWIV